MALYYNNIIYQRVCQEKKIIKTSVGPTNGCSDPPDRSGGAAPQTFAPRNFDG